MSTRKALAFSFLDRHASLAISVASSMVIARLLTPAQVGVYSVAMMLMTFLATVRDLGAGEYLVQEKQLTDDRIRAVWAVQLGLGLLLSFVVAAASVPVAAFYHEPVMRDLMLIAAISYAINPFGSITYAWLMREMRFNAIALIRLSGAVVSALTSITLAWRGFGALSLAIGGAAGTLAIATISLWFRPQALPWAPGVRELRRVFSFGTRMTATSILNTVSNSVPEIVLGKMQDMTAAGLYSRSNGLVSMFSRLVTDAVNSVSLPWFAKQSRERTGLAEPFVKASAYFTATCWSFCLALVFLAHPITRVLFGPQWDASVDATRLLAIALSMGAPAALCWSVLVAEGATTALLRVTATGAMITVVLVLIAAPFGLLALGGAMIAAAALIAPVWLRTVRRHVKFSWRALARAHFKSGLVAMASAVIPGGVFFVFGPHPESSLLPLAIAVPGAVIGFVSGALGLHHPIGVELLRIFRSLRILNR